MRQSSRTTARAWSRASVLASALLLAVSAAPSVSAQNANGPLAPPPASSAQGASSGANTPDARQTDGPIAAPTRERRAQAYAKLLEGQRHYSAARTGSLTMDGLRSAQSAFQQAADLDPTLSEARTALAEIAFFFLNDLPLAEREASAAVRINRDNVGAHRVLSRVHALQSKLAEATPERASAERAVAELREIVRLRPGDAEAWALLGEFYFALGRDDEAAEAFRRWAGAPAPIDVRFFQVITKGRELTPDAANARLAETLLRLGKTQEAAVAARQAWMMSPENPAHLQLFILASAQLAQAHADESRFDEAIKIYEDLLKARGVGDTLLADRSVRRFAAPLLGEVALLRQRAGQAAEASAMIERMRRVLGAEDPAPDVYAVDLLREQGKSGEALEAARTARRRLPDDAQLVYREARLLAESGRVDEAASLYRGRLKGAPTDYDEYLSLASVLITGGRGREAADAARKALELVPANQDELTVRALLLLSSAQDRAGDFKGSEESLRQILSKDPDNVAALNNLGYFLTERNERLGEALEMIQRAVRAAPGNASYLDSLGWVYFKLGKLEEAERYLRDAARRNPNSAAIQEHLGDLFNSRGMAEQARAAWQKALSLSTEPADIIRIKTKLGDGASR